MPLLRSGVLLDVDGDVERVAQLSTLAHRLSLDDFGLEFVLGEGYANRGEREREEDQGEYSEEAAHWKLLKANTIALEQRRQQLAEGAEAKTT